MNIKFVTNSFSTVFLFCKIIYISDFFEDEDAHTFIYCVYMYVCMYIYIYMCVCVYACMCVSIGLFK